MSSNGFAQPLRIELRRSRRLLLVIAAAHGGALLCIALASVGLTLQLALGVATLLSAIISYTRHCGDRRPLLLVWDSAGLWHLGLSGGRLVDATLMGSPYVTPAAIVLQFRANGGGHLPLVLLPDSAEEGDLRRLRVRLRLEAGKGEESQALNDRSDKQYTHL